MIGETVGNFVIVSRLGKGAMGEVYLAEQKSIKTKVAIKVLQSDVNPTHVQRFFNEAVASSQIHHSGIVKIFDVGFTARNQAYLVMEYLEGESLAARIKRVGRLGIAHVADFGRQIASVLDATHATGIIHRDLKPDNIYLVRDVELPLGERVKILDFGIAKLAPPGGPRMTALSVGSIGTPNYMSPEQWHSLAEVDWRTDAYALGCVAFEMACGRPPFVAESLADACAQHMTEPPPVPSLVAPGLPTSFDDIVRRLLEKEPAARPTMREVMTAFTVLGQDQGVALRSIPPKPLSELLPPITSPLTTTTPPPRKSRRTAWLVGIGALVLGGSVGAAVVLTSRAHDEANEATAPPRDAAVAIDAGVVAAVDAASPDAAATPMADAAPSGPVQVATLPPHKGAVPVVREPHQATVCIDERGAVTSVDGDHLPAQAREIMQRWIYEPYRQGGTPIAVCGPETLQPRTIATPQNQTPANPDKLTQKQFEDTLDHVRDPIAACDRFPVSGRVDVRIDVAPNGKAVATASSPDRELNKCIAKAIGRAAFPKTRLGGIGNVTFMFHGNGGFDDDDDGYRE
ncbi:MAG TPA: protein kinase [Kofleriaceae bacterium]|nr:protein kinase [Kofleriaceae bacterium]